MVFKDFYIFYPNMLYNICLDSHSSKKTSTAIPSFFINYVQLSSSIFTDPFPLTTKTINTLIPSLVPPPSSQKEKQPPNTFWDVKGWGV